MDGEGRVACHDPIKIARLVRVSGITEADFPNLAPLAAKTCFEGQALSALRANKPKDALAWSELGVSYEIYRKHKYPDHEINFRIVKLFAGICYRYRFYGHIPKIRKKVVEFGLLTKFQPPPQRWLGTASDFKYRWRARDTYNGVLLPKP